MKFNLFETAKKNVMIVAHRGTCGGNIPCNTLTACEIALKQGADMLEVDISCSADGKLFLFHPLKETAHLTKPLLLGALPYSVIKKLHYTNFDNTKTQFTIADFDDATDLFESRVNLKREDIIKNPPPGLNPEDMEIAFDYHDLDNRGKRSVKNVIKSEIDALAELSDRR